MGDIEGAIDRANAYKGVVPDDADPTRDIGSIKFNDDGTGEAEFLGDFDPGETEDSGDLLDKAQEALRKFARALLGDHADMVEILDIVEVTMWGFNPHTGEPYPRFKAKIKRGMDLATKAIADRVVARAAALGPRTPPEPRVGKSATLHYLWADCQFGKGTEELFGFSADHVADRMDWIIHEGIPQLHADQVAAGYAVDRGVFANMGDATEGEAGSYQNQNHTIQFGPVTQEEVATGWAHQTLDVVSDLHSVVDATAVCSNHDNATRRDERDSFTGDWDDRSFRILRTLRRAAAMAPERYGHVRFVMPRDPVYSVLTDVNGLNVLYTHGHRPKFRQSGVRTIKEWHDGQAASNTRAGRCQVICSAHFHHGFDLWDSGRLFAGSRTFDNGSKYYMDANGTWSMPGMRVLLTADGEPPRTFDLVYPGDYEVARKKFGRIAG